MSGEPRSAGRRLREAYDSAWFGPGPRADLRRDKSPADVAINGHFLTLLSRTGLASEAGKLAHVVWLFPAAAHRTNESFQLGRYLRETLHPDVKDRDLPVRARRFRQLIAARDRDERAHHLRRLLAHAYQRSDRRPVDWGVIAADLVRFGDKTRRRWAESFFLRFPTPAAPEATDV